MTNPLPLPDERSYQDGYADGLKAAESLNAADLPVLSLANALDHLAKHYAAMDNADELYHVGCLECSTSVLLARVVHFGDETRRIEREQTSK